MILETKGLSCGDKKKMSIVEKEIDCANAARGVWLVKVPKYISTRWEKADSLTEVGRLKIAKGSGGKPEITFKLAEDLVNMKDPGDKTVIPRDHQFAVSTIPNQVLAVFSEPRGDNSGESVLGQGESNGKIVLEGHVVQKGECRPIVNEKYMQLKRQSILQASQPQRSVKQIAKIVQNFKPVSDHKNNIEFEQRKKAEGKKSREDKEKVMDMLFAAFEKHQYYNLKDLEKITRQPIPYLKEILKEICNYNAKNPHKNMWELKPEFRHYKEKNSAS
ncbi:transcription factor TFIIFbeta isoform X2 [Tachypleus tridentatus]|uniref:transcription factor TFIIFbeta isoform X2 n=1 Tax=Tachypleus tridentatus TaxID=6853 RepID=UPI003FD2EC5F